MIIVMNSKLRDALREGVESERGNWDDDEINRNLRAIDAINDNDVVELNDDDDIDESNATDAELVALQIDYFGLHNFS